MRGILALAVLAVLSACSHDVYTPVTPATNIYSSYTDKIPGHWLATVEPPATGGTIKVTGYICSAHDFPLTADTAYLESVRKTLLNVFEEVETVPAEPLDKEAETLRTAGALGLIRVEHAAIEPRVTFVPGFFVGTAQADADMSARVTVDGPDGRLYGSKVDGRGSATSDGECNAGAPALSQAISKAMLDMMEDLGERLSNAEQLRSLPKTQASSAPTS
ncbi:hypothetical protein SAMN06265365_102421 [Tistlia consotensis]|uniref:Lipoprotein n=2 Tax=Tistlia TaxID=1321364 RepID=A0A1Y6C5U6_9PROT|nr:hypothetical protein SAMN05428998_11342 [Tistlia consotensis USBA 355]SNR37043.1 hypothetical protein SAMN06265365_102421 [Tistlia consotensis]